MYLVLAFLIISALGYFFGKIRGAGFIEQMYERRNFTLLEDNGNFFELKSLPEKRLALLIFTPDAIPSNMVKPLFDFGRAEEFFRSKNIELILVTRTNSEIVKNFKRATRFPGRLLIDSSGTVGRLSGVWGEGEAKGWGYLLTDNKFGLLWRHSSPQVLGVRDFVQLWAEKSDETKK